MKSRLVVATVVAVTGRLGVSALHASTSGQPSALTISAPTTANLGSGAPGTIISAAIGPVTVTDDRA